MAQGRVAALMTISFYTSAIPAAHVDERVARPLIETRANIEHALEFMYADASVPGPGPGSEIGLDF